MKKFFGVLALAGLVGGAVILLRPASEAMPPPPLPAVTIECIGTAGTTTTGCCNASGPRDFAYRVKLPTGGAVQVTRIDIGTHWPDPNDYVNLLMPSGWTMTILGVDPLWDDRMACDAHGSTVAPDSPPACPYILRWTGPAQTAPFTLGFDVTRSFDVHDVSWKSNTGNQSNWSFPLGQGRGPVHCLAFP